MGLCIDGGVAPGGGGTRASMGGAISYRTGVVDRGMEVWAGCVRARGVLYCALPQVGREEVPFAARILIHRAAWLLLGEGGTRGQRLI
jgi:hypothetical protein